MMLPSPSASRVAAPTGYRIGHCLDVLADVPDGAFDCCVTSPPYWGLRDYGDEGKPWPSVEYSPMPGLDPVTVAESTCPLGLEPTVAEYVAHIVHVFREVRRTLRDDGTLWLNLGDSYAGSWGAQGRTGSMAARSAVSARQIESHPQRMSRTGSIAAGAGHKAKDLVGIPWRVAFALQADGWWLRSDIVWSKPNPMPESVTDRPTRAHEYVFLLAKSARYVYDAAASAELSVSEHPSGNGFRREHRLSNPRGQESQWEPGEGKTRNRRSVWHVATTPFAGAHFATFPPELIKPCILAGCPEGGTVLDPFLGSGTTGMVAESLGRRWFGAEQNPEYEAIIRARTIQAGLVFA